MKNLQKVVKNSSKTVKTLGFPGNLPFLPGLLEVLAKSKV
jgi:hypothetical protein